MKEGLQLTINLIILITSLISWLENNLKFIFENVINCTLSINGQEHNHVL